MRSSLSRNLLCWTLGLTLFLPLGLSAQPAEESAVKAAFVYNFIVFTAWPANALQAEGTIDLCVNSGSPMVSALSVLDGKPIRSARIRLQHLDTIEIVPPSCRILYLDRFDRKAWSRTKRQLANASVLTISDDTEIDMSGVIFGLSTQNSRIVFDIDAQAAESAGLKINPKLLRLARKVR